MSQANAVAPRAGRPDWWVARLTLAVAALSTWPQLPRGVCFGDGGGLQLASATLGITHPPGYVVYTTLWYLISLILPFEPAFAVTVCSWLMGLVVFVLVVFVFSRWGASPWFGGATALALLMNPVVRQNCLAPEVYAPTLCLLVLAILLWSRFLCGKQISFAYAAGAMFGMAWVSRPPTILILPFVLLSYRLARGRFSPKGAREWAREGALAAVVLAPFLFSFAYVFARDTPRTTFNYLAQYEIEHGDLPARTATVGSRVQRVLWLSSAQQFRGGIHVTFWGTVSKLRWVSNRIAPNQPALFAAILLLALLGVVTAWRVDGGIATLVIGLGLSSLAFVCAYRVYDLAADLLPVIFALGAFAGMGLWTLISNFGARWSQRIAVALFATMAVATIAHGFVHRRDESPADARSFLARADVASLPADSVVLTGWYQATPLWYEQHVVAGRDDLTILCLDRGRWSEYAERYAGRALFAVERPGADDPFEAHERGSLWEWKRKAP